MTKQDVVQDLIVVGGGPAGCAAALAARRRDLSCLVVDRGARADSTCPGWAGPAAIALCRELGFAATDLGATEFRGVHLWSWDGTQSADVDDRALTGWLLDAGRLRRALQEAVRAAGVDVVAGSEVERLELGEEYATAHAGAGFAVMGQVIVIASGADAAYSGLAPVPISQGRTGWEAAQAVFDPGAASPGLHVALGGGRSMRVAVVVTGPHETRVTVYSQSRGRPAKAQLEEFLATARQAGMVPADVAARYEPVAGLAGIALEAESHVGKRTVVCGDAGGFVASFSHEGFYPGLRSAVVAADVAADALAAPVLQDELATYSARWRTELADYLQMPNTDLGLLLPMVFSNPQMSARLARAFLLGQAF